MAQIQPCGAGRSETLKQRRSDQVSGSALAFGMGVVQPIGVLMPGKCSDGSWIVQNVIPATYARVRKPHA